MDAVDELPPDEDRVATPGPTDTDLAAQSTWADARPRATPTPPPRTRTRFLRVASAPVGPAPEADDGTEGLTPTVVVALQKAPSLRSVTHVSSMKAADELIHVESKLQSQSSFTQQVKQRVSSVLKSTGLDLLDNDSANVKSLWSVFDVDGDGVIDYKEFCQYTTELLERRRRKSGIEMLSLLEAKFVRLVNREVRREGDLERVIDIMFKKLDHNGSGKISLLEFRDGVRELGLMDYNFDVHGQKRRFADMSLFILKPEHRVRYWIVWLVEWKWFDRFILGCIFANSLILGFKDYSDPGMIADANGKTSISWRNEIVEECESVFSYIFVAECGLKILAMGLVFGKGAYLRSHWNQLDCFVVVVGLISDIPGVPKVSAIRSARLLRPLRTLTNLRGMRILIHSLFSAIPALFNVMVILAFAFTVFGILGVLLWNGILHYRCRETPEPVNGTWALAGDGPICGGAYTCPDDQYCGSIYNLPANTTVNFSNLSSAEIWDYQYTNFDHIGRAILTLFQCITLEGWTSIMYNFQDAHNWMFATLYFVTFTIIGAFFLLQFIFAVIWERFKAVSDNIAVELEATVRERVASLEEVMNAPAVRKDPRRAQLRKKVSFQESFRHGIQSTYVVVKNQRIKYRIRMQCRRLVKNNYFNGFVVGCILLNTLSLALDGYPSNHFRDLIAEKLNLVLTFIFCLEMVLKLIGLTWKEYRADRYNLFDGAVVAISLVELTLNLVDASSKSTGLSALRAFRLFRILKLARSWKSLRDLFRTIANSLFDVANFGLLLLLLMYVFALIGMQFFANKYRFNAEGDPVVWQPHLYNTTVPPHAPWTPEKPYTIRRSNFDDTLAAFTTIFQCLTEESWNFVMYDGIRAAGWGAAAYFIIVMVLCNIIILNLFLAILLGNFGLDEVSVETNKEIISSSLNLKLSTVVPMQSPPRAERSPSLMTVMHIPSERRLQRHRRHSSARSAISTRERTRPPEVNKTALPTIDSPTATFESYRKFASVNHGTEWDGRSEASTFFHASSHIPFISQTSLPGSRRKTAVLPKSESKHDDRSLYLFSRKSKIRLVSWQVVHNSRFESLLLFVILVSCIELSMDNPLNDPNSTLTLVIAIVDKVVTGIFVLEMVLKVINLGFAFNGSHSYMRDPWNVLDLGILISSLATLFSSNNTLRSLRSMRTLRALRPLRMISRVPGMKRVMHALLSSIPCIMNVFLVCSLIFLMFGIIGVNLFKGRLYYCDMSSFSDSQMTRLEATYGFTSLSFKTLFSEANCLQEGGYWVINPRNYDNVFKSAMTLFELGTTEGWVDIMWAGVDATEIGYHPVQNWNRAYIAFFVVFIIIGSFFTLNLFVGAVIDNFNRMRDTLDHGESDTQREWLQIQDLLRGTKLKRKKQEPKHWLRRCCFRLQHHWVFDAVIALCVLSNTLLLSITHFQQSAQTTSDLSSGNLVFSVVFFVEAGVKLLALGLKYFQDSSNRFDFAVVVGSTISTILPLFTNGKISPVANTLRAFRMGLAIRLMKRAKSMQNIITTILDNMPALVNVSTLMFLIMFVYAVIGVQIYAGVKLGYSLNEQANFKDIFLAMVTLFRFTTGEAWNDVMYDLMVLPIAGEKPYPYGASCVENFTYDMLVAAREYTGDSKLTIGCTPSVQVTYIYFLSYMLLTSYVLLNLFVAVILEGFEETAEKNASALTKNDLTLLCELWESYDPLASGFISDHNFTKFAREVPPPLGLPAKSSRADVDRWLRSLNLMLENGGIGFQSFLLATTQQLMFNLAAVRGDEIQPARGAESFFARSQKVVRRVARSRMSQSAVPTLHAVLAAKRIQAAMRGKLVRKEFVRLKTEMDLISTS